MQESQLLIPRYEIIGPYPKMSLGMFTIITLTPDIENPGVYRFISEADQINLTEKELDYYSNIFRKMHWAEFIRPCDFPKYLQAPPPYNDVIEIKGDVERVMVGKLVYYQTKETGTSVTYAVNKFYFPVTKKEYEEYRKNE